MLVNRYLSFLFLISLVFNYAFADLTIPGVETKAEIQNEYLILNFNLKNRAGPPPPSEREAIVDQLENYPNSTIEISRADGPSETNVQFKISKTDLINSNLYLFNKMNLPGNRSIPGILKGVLPGQELKKDEFFNLRMYCDETAFGIFLPVKLESKTTITDKFYYNNKRIGNISLVGKDNDGKNSGVLVLLNKSLL